MVSQEQVQRFAELFQGLHRAFGRYELDNSAKGKKKQGRAMTVKAPLLLENYQQHLEGKVGLGIIPITDNATCHWGAIDVDSYDINHAELYEKTKDWPVVICRSKSGGAHIFLFFKDPVSAELCRDKLSELAARLALGGSEIFPKQVKLITEHGDTGNWLNMPYFGGDRSTRYALQGGCSLSLDEFLDYAQRRQMSAEELEEWVITPASKEKDDPFLDGPPCLRILSQFGFPEGFRNRALSAIAVYLKKRFPDDWQDRVEEYNHTLMKPPLKSAEVLATVKSMGRKEYNYQCREEPLRSHCDRANCLLQKFGVSSDMSGENLPIFSGLTKIETDPPLWFLTVDGHRVGPLQTTELLHYQQFRMKVAEQVNRLLPDRVSTARWSRICNEMFEQMEVITMPEDVTLIGMFWNYLTDIVTHQTPAPTMTEFIRGNHYFEDGKFIYMKFRTITDYLRKQRFSIDQNMMAIFLREKKAELINLNVGNVTANVWKIPNFIDQIETLPIPNTQEKEF